MSMTVTGWTVVGDEIIFQITDSLETSGQVLLPMELESKLRDELNTREGP